MKKNIINNFFFLLIFLFLGTSALAAKAREDKPNVLFIAVDDLKPHRDPYPTSAPIPEIKRKPKKKKPKPRPK